MARHCAIGGLGAIRALELQECSGTRPTICRSVIGDDLDYGQRAIFYALGVKVPEASGIFRSLL